LYCLFQRKLRRIVPFLLVAAVPPGLKRASAPLASLPRIPTPRRFRSSFSQLTETGVRPMTATAVPAQIVSDERDRSGPDELPTRRQPAWLDAGPRADTISRPPIWPARVLESRSITAQERSA
jgi:hypothetical protein